MVNYYELLEISQDADRKTIEKAIRKIRRLWNNRANSPDASIRAEAERHVREIAEAEKILFDDAQRSEYNRQLAENHDSNQNPTSNNGPSSEWEDDYWQAYNRGMNGYAAQLAQEVLRSNDRDGNAWFLYGEALRRDGRIEDGINALQRATMFLPNESKVYRQLGFAYLDANMQNDALQAFYRASDCDSMDSEFYALRAMIFRNAGMAEDAIKEARKAFEMTPNDDSIRLEYFLALYSDAEKAMSYNRSSGKYLITNKVQLDYVNNVVKEMSQALPNGNDKEQCVKMMDEIIKIVVDAESTKKVGFFSSKIGYEANYDTANADTRASGIH